MTKNQTERAEAIARLKEWGIQPGDTIYCILRSVSRSGMSRCIDFVYFLGDGTKRHLGYTVAQALGMPFDRQREGVKIGGCGMDMGFHAVYETSRVLFPEGFGVLSNPSPMGHTVRPPTPDKAEAARIKGYTFRGRNGDTSGWDNDGGYALKHEWL